MKLLEKHVNNKNQIFNFWHGFDLETIENHPSDGSKGMMIVFVETKELIIMTKTGDIQDLDIKNNYIAFYEVPDRYNQFNNLIRKFKMKFNQPFKGLFGVNTGSLA